MLNQIVLNKSNLIHNFLEFKKLISPNTKIVSVVKANAYGHGLKEIAGILEDYTDYFQVDDIEELRRIREITQKPVLVLGYVMECNLEEMVDLKGILGIYSLRQIELLSEIGVKRNESIPVHICVDSHLGRDGILAEDIGAFLAIAINAPNIQISGYYSHFANIEDTNDRSHANKQIQTFEEVKKKFKEYGYENALTHISATSGILEYEKNQNSTNHLVRLGIGLYGIWPSELLEAKHKDKIELKPIASFKSHLAQVKTLKAGHTVGYGLTYTTIKETKVGIVPVGYSDGIERAISNKGIVLVRGQRCPIIGRISMNMLTIDLTKLSEVNVEDEVVILGKQGNDEITSDEIVQTFGSFNYEMLARLSPLIPRIIE